MIMMMMMKYHYFFPFLLFLNVVWEFDFDDLTYLFESCHDNRILKESVNLVAFTMLSISSGEGDQTHIEFVRGQMPLSH